MSRNSLGKKVGYRIDSYGQPVKGEPEQLSRKTTVDAGLLRRPVTKERDELLAYLSPLA